MNLEVASQHPKVNISLLYKLLWNFIILLFYCFIKFLLKANIRILINMIASLKAWILNVIKKVQSKKKIKFYCSSFLSSIAEQNIHNVRKLLIWVEYIKVYSNVYVDLRYLFFLYFAYFLINKCKEELRVNSWYFKCFF